MKLSEWAELNGITLAAARQRAKRGVIDGLVKVGGQWEVIDVEQFIAGLPKMPTTPVPSAMDSDPGRLGRKIEDLEVRVKVLEELMPRQIPMTLHVEPERGPNSITSKKPPKQTESQEGGDSQWSKTSKMLPRRG
jgi:hypothetical protein